RIITVKAEVTVSGKTYSVTQAVSFGNGPLSAFKAPVGTSSYLTWSEAYQACNGSPYTGVDPTYWTANNYVGGGKMPTRQEYQAVSRKDTYWSFENPNPNAQGAAFAAGWPEEAYWTGEASGGGGAYCVILRDGRAIDQSISSNNKYAVACRR
ncbi:MAG: hypothetical protein LBO77_04160, partial [Desulfovibrio sp.]|nr:hypothetical protein [Desulfovibrio sp.]